MKLIFVKDFIKTNSSLSLVVMIDTLINMNNKKDITIINTSDKGSLIDISKFNKQDKVYFCGSWGRLNIMAAANQLKISGAIPIIISDLTWGIPENLVNIAEFQIYIQEEFETIKFKDILSKGLV